jgi:hypothetical protein
MFLMEPSHQHRFWVIYISSFSSSYSLAGPVSKCWGVVLPFAIMVSRTDTGMPSCSLILYCIVLYCIGNSGSTAYFINEVELRLIESVLCFIQASDTVAVLIIPCWSGLQTVADFIFKGKERVGYCKSNMRNNL